MIFRYFEPKKKKERNLSFLIRQPQIQEEPEKKLSQTLNFKRNLMDTNVHAEVRGKYARMPVLNPRSLSAKHNAYESVFANSRKKQDTKHQTVLEKRRRFVKLRSSEPVPKTAEVVDQDIKELTRLLKIERLKRLIIQKKLEVQDCT